jgi:putative addiction module component (TIGR02574 family)
MRSAEIPQIAFLSKEEKILFIEELWDELSMDDSDIGVPLSHQKELDNRYQNFKKNQDSLLSIQDLQSRIAKQK